jgi:hypothetical protein
MTEDDRRVLFAIVRAISGRDEHGRFTRKDPGAVRRLEAFIGMRERASREDGAQQWRAVADALRVARRVEDSNRDIAESIGAQPARGTLAQRLLAWRARVKV